MIKQPGKCIFCTKPGLSREHIWPQWAREVLLSNGVHKSNVSEHIVGRKDKVDIHTIKPRQGPIINKRLLVVCKDCNNVWMSALEDKCKPILLTLMTVGVDELDLEKQSTLAQWAVLKAMICDQSQKDEVVFTQEQREAFMNQRAIPNGVNVWIGKSFSDKWFSSYTRCTGHLVISPTPTPVSFLGAEKKNVQTTAIGMGRLFIYVMVSNATGVDLNNFIRINQLIQLWPTTKERIVLPLHQFLGTPVLDAIGVALTTLLKSDGVIQVDIPQ